MSNVFDVTTPTTTVVLNASRHGQAAFDVVNRSPDVTMGEARLVPDNPASENWIRLAQVSLRRFAVTGTEQYLVLVDVPEGAPGGGYAFRLDMAQADHPEQDAVRGPSVQFQVPGAKPARAARRFPWSLFGR